MKKLLIFVLIAITLSISVFAVHESIPNVNWDNSQLNSFKNEDSCRCWSLTETAKKYRNKELDALLVAKACTQACDHCELKEGKEITSCLNQCLSTGALSKESQLINCMQICTQNYCTNELKLVTQKTVIPEVKKEEQKPEVKIPEPVTVPEPKKEVIKEEPPKEVEVVEEPEVKEEPKPKEILTLDECKNLAEKTKKENFCSEELTFVKFIEELNQVTSENKDNSACTTTWNEYYKEEKKKCKTGPINYLKEKKLLMPAILILAALIIMLGAFFYYRHREKWHPIEWPKEKEEQKEEIHLEIPEELKEPQKPKEKQPVKNKRRPKPFTQHPEFYVREDNQGIEQH